MQDAQIRACCNGKRLVPAHFQILPWVFRPMPCRVVGHDPRKVALQSRSPTASRSSTRRPQDLREHYSFEVAEKRAPSITKKSMGERYISMCSVPVESSSIFSNV